MAKSYVIGIDIGGTKMRGALFFGAKILRYQEFSTPKSLKGFEKVIENLTPPLNIRGGGWGVELPKIGVGAAGIVKGGVLVKSPNISYIKNFNFKNFLKEYKIELDNDARCFLRGEYGLGWARRAKKAFGLTLGTGIGRSYGELKKRKPVVQLIKKFEYPEKFEKKYQKLRDAGDDRRLAECLAEKLTPVIKPYSPEILVIGGGVSNRKNFLKILRWEFKKQGLKAKVAKAALWHRSVILGAAMLF